jgi:RNA polymerase sigma-70 factor, ECF subfamily
MPGTCSAPGIPDYSVPCLLMQSSEGHHEAGARLASQIYERTDGHYRCLDRPNHNLQSTAIVHEAYARLVQLARPSHLCLAPVLTGTFQRMKHILDERARVRQAERCGGDQRQISFIDSNLATQTNSSPHDAVRRISKFDPRQVRIMEVHFSGELLFEETTSIRHIFERPTRCAWTRARTYLKCEHSNQL